MFKLFKRQLIVLIALQLFLINLAQATEITGSIEGKIGKQTQKWVTFTLPSAGSTSTFGTLTDPFTDVSIQGHITEEYQIKDAINISMTLMNGNLLESGFKYFHESTQLPYFGDHKNSIQITLNSFDVKGEIASISGTVKGKIFKYNSYTRPPDIDSGVEIDLTFSVEATKE